MNIGGKFVVKHENEQRKRGRPKKIGSKKERLEVRLSDKDSDLLNYLCCQTGKNKTDIVRESLKMYSNLVKYSDN